MYKLIASHRFYNMNAEIETVQFDDGIMVKRLVSFHPHVLGTNRSW